MKTLSFKLQPITPGQKSSLAAVVPQLIANSTNGKFTVTPPVTKALNIAAGDCVMFFDNSSDIETAISTNNPDLVAYCQEKSYDMTTPEGQEAIKADFLEYYIAKGELMYKANGEPLTEPIRFTKEDKEAYIAKNMEALVAENRAVLIERNGGEDADDETLGALITVDDIESPRVQSAYGSRTATTSNKTGVGLQLGFTDTNIWNQLKADLGEDKLKINRYYDVNLTTPAHVQFDNGKEKVDVLAYPISHREDKEASRNFGRDAE